MPSVNTLPDNVPRTCEVRGTSTPDNALHTCEVRGASDADSSIFLCPIADWASLTGDLLREGKTIRVRVRGGSMHPAIRDGDTLCLAPVQADQLHPGQVVLYVRPDGRPLVHRIIRREQQDGALYFEICADHPPAAADRVPASSILGSVQAIERDGRRFALRGVRGRLWEWFFLLARPWRPLLSRVRRVSKIYQAQTENSPQRRRGR